MRQIRPSASGRGSLPTAEVSAVARVRAAWRRRSMKRATPRFARRARRRHCGKDVIRSRVLANGGFTSARTFAFVLTRKRTSAARSLAPSRAGGTDAPEQRGARPARAGQLFDSSRTACRQARVPRRRVRARRVTRRLPPNSRELRSSGRWRDRGSRTGPSRAATVGNSARAGTFRTWGGGAGLSVGEMRSISMSGVIDEPTTGRN